MMNKKRKEALKRFFELKNQEVFLEFIEVERYRYDKVLEVLSGIVDKNEECFFDLTGGKELILTAMGEVSITKNIPMIQFNPRNGRFIRVKNADGIVEPAKVALSLREEVVLNGGDLVSSSDGCFHWDLNEDFRRDIRRMWDISKKNCTEWNRFIVALESLEPSCEKHTNLLVSASLRNLSEEKQKILSDSDYIGLLSDAGLLLEVKKEDSKLEFRYKNRQVQRVLSKAGNILELYVYLVAHEISEEEIGFFSDIGIGVIIDWDGQILNYGKIETRNEIDIFLMRGLIPVFVSCKNGEVHKDALYELFSVAQRFGGEYAKKILVTNYVNSSYLTRKYILQRAQDMQIEIVDSIDQMSHAEVKTLFRKNMF